MKLKKFLSCVTALALTTAMVAGCAPTKVGSSKSSDGKIHISIGGSPVERTEKNAATYDLFQENVAKFEEQNPDIEITPDGWSFDLKNYLTKAAAGDLPTTYFTSPTEVKNIIKNGYAKDITSIVKKYGYDKKINEKYSSLIKYDGKYYGLIKNGSIYNIGLAYNIDLFKQAGLLDENGIPKYPQTWEELAETAKTIKDKTGKAGFAIPDMKNHGGWFFMNILWAYGAEMMEQKDGKWVATFASENGVEALQFIKDLKWKYNVLPSSDLISLADIEQSFAVGDVAMYIEIPSQFDNMVTKYNFDITNVAMSKLPAGPAGRFSQIGANVYMFTGDDDQNEACLKWFEFIGEGSNVTDGMKAQWEKTYKIKNEKKQLVGIAPSDYWVDEERMKAEQEIIDKYRTIEQKYFDDYSKAEGVTFKFEPEKCVQQMYAALDTALQQVITDKNADCKTVLENVQKDFQLNYLDKEAE